MSAGRWGSATHEYGLPVAGRVVEVLDDGALIDGAPVRLTPAPLAMLKALATRPGHVLSRAELMSHLPSGQALNEHAVEAAVARLRAAVGTELVHTVVKRGYRLAMEPTP
ncbi:MAG TPA: winged helix-turn-helix domain-containing protein [Dermatophilaceae bacterium]|nr:winged helix-turn-helix domain-containing protein [Dermatophilaceae bacterium]